MTIRIRRSSGRAISRLCAQSSASPSIFSLSKPSRIMRPRWRRAWRYGSPPRPYTAVGGGVGGAGGWGGAAGGERTARGEPRFAALSALPAAGGEAEDFGRHSAAFEGAGEDVGADRGDRDRTAAHRA